MVAPPMIDSEGTQRASPSCRAGLPPSAADLEALTDAAAAANSAEADASAKASAAYAEADKLERAAVAAIKVRDAAEAKLDVVTYSATSDAAAALAALRAFEVYFVAYHAAEPAKVASVEARKRSVAVAAEADAAFDALEDARAALAAAEDAARCAPICCYCGKDRQGLAFVCCEN